MISRYKTSGYEPLYTLTEAEKIIDWNRSKTVRKRKAERLYFIKQKFCGVVMLSIGIVIPFILDGDATFSLLAVPLGTYLLVARQKVMSFRWEVK